MVSYHINSSCYLGKAKGDKEAKKRGSTKEGSKLQGNVGNRTNEDKVIKEMGMFHGGDMKNVTEDSKSVKKRGRDDGKKKQTDLIVAREKITTGGAEMKVVSMLKGTVHQNDGNMTESRPRKPDHSREVNNREIVKEKGTQHAQGDRGRDAEEDIDNWKTGQREKDRKY